MIPALSLLAALAAATPAPAAPEAAGQGLIAYPTAFFADARPATALDMVQRLPGFSLDGGATVRGFEGGAGNVLVDGARPVSKTDDLEEILRRIPASQVDHLELIRGGAPGIDMQGKSMLANVVRSKTGGTQGLIAIANNHVLDDGRDAFGVRLEGSGRVGPGAWEGGARYGQGIDDGAGPGPRLRLDPSGATLIASDIRSHGFGGQYVFTGAYETPLAEGKLRVNGRVFRDHYRYNELNWIGYPAPGLESTHDDEVKLQTEAGARYSRAFGARTQLELVALRQTEDKDFESVFRAVPTESDFSLNKSTVETIGRGVLKYRWGDGLSLEAGGEGALNTLDSHTAFLQGGVAVGLPAANVTVEEKRGEAFAKAVWRPTPKLTVEGGLRYEGSAISSKGDVVLEKTLYFAKPRLAVTWAPQPSTQLRVRFERVVGQLNFNDFVASSSLNTGVLTAGNPDLSPEQAWVSEAALEQRFWKNGAAVVTIRHSALTDAVDRAPVFSPTGGVFDAPSNIGDGTKDELLFTLALPLDRMLKGAQIRGESTWRRSEVTDPTTGAKREISGLRPVEWQAHFTHDLPRLRMSWGVDAYGGWRETYYRFNEISTDKLKTYVVLFGEWKPQPDLTVRAELNNATERGFRHTRQVFSGPRNTSGPAYVDDRDIQFGRGLYLRVRKSFG